MKLRRSVTLFFVLLSAVCVYAENRTVVENFNTLHNNGGLDVTGNVGTTAFATYTCSGGNARFVSNYDTGFTFCIFLEKSGAKVVTSEIEGLDSLAISYYPEDDYVDFYVYTSPTGEDGSWTFQTVQYISKGKSAVKLSEQGNCYVKIVRRTNIYIREIEYYMERCACFPYVAE